MVLGIDEPKKFRTNSTGYLVGVYDEDGCGEGEAATQQPVLVQAVQLLQVGQRDTGLLTPPTRLHPFQCLDTTLWLLLHKHLWQGRVRGGGSGDPAASPRSGCAAPPGRAARYRSPHPAHAPSLVPVPRYNSLVTTPQASMARTGAGRGKRRPSSQSSCRECSSSR
jgi:hypothetical protein